MKTNPVKLESGEVLSIEKRNGRPFATLSYAGECLESDLPIYSEIPQAIKKLYSPHPRVVASLSKDRKIVHILPKGGLSGGNPLMRHLGAFESAINSTITADQIAEALIQENIDPRNIPPSLARKVLGIVAQILDPTKAFEGFSDDLAQAAEEHVQQFAARLAKAQALTQAWVDRHFLVEKRKNLINNIPNLKSRLKEKQKSLEEISSKIHSLDTRIQEKQRLIDNFEEAKQNPAVQNLESKIKELRQSEANLQRYGADPTEARNARILAEKNARRLQELAQEMNRHRNDIQNYRKEKEELARSSNHLKQEIGKLETEIAKAQTELSQAKKQLGY